MSDLDLDKLQTEAKELGRLFLEAPTTEKAVITLAHGIDRMFKGMFDLSHLYRTEKLVIAHDGTSLFEVTVQEVSQESYAKLQDSLMKTINLDMPTGKKGRNSAEMIQQQIMSQALQSGKFSPSRYSAEQSVLAIKEWTLKDKDGNAVPVGLEAWNALPKWITDEIEKGIERLNPTLDEEFQD